MELYIEYVFLENFLVDYLLLWLSLRLLRRKIYPLKLFLSALFGGIFALLYPFISLPIWAQKTLQFCVGALLSLLSSKENGGGRYAINAVCFLFLSAALAGAAQMLFGQQQYKEGVFLAKRLKTGGLFLSLAIFAILLSKSVSAIYRIKKTAPFLRDCEIFIGEKSIKIKGFCDSGNLAFFRERPVYFIHPDRLLEIISTGQVCDEMEILTVSGAKKIKIFKADKLLIYFGKERNIIENVYLSPSPSLRGCPYEAILHG